MVLLCGDGLFGPRAAEGTCSEGPSPISPWLCGGGAGGSFGNLGGCSLPITNTTTIVSGTTAITTFLMINLSILVQCILNIDRLFRTVRTHPPTNSVKLNVTISFIYTEYGKTTVTSTTIQPPVCLVTL